MLGKRKSGLVKCFEITVQLILLFQWISSVSLLIKLLLKICKMRAGRKLWVTDWCKHGVRAIPMDSFLVLCLLFTHITMCIQHLFNIVAVQKIKNSNNSFPKNCFGCISLSHVLLFNILLPNILHIPHAEFALNHFMFQKAAWLHLSGHFYMQTFKQVHGIACQIDCLRLLFNANAGADSYVNVCF